MWNRDKKLLAIIALMSLTTVLLAQERKLQPVTKSNLVTQSAAEISANQATRKPVFKQGFKAFIDPSTGQLTSPPNISADSLEINDTTNLSVEQSNAMQTSHQGLYEERMPDGSTRVNLQGRFQSRVYGYIDKSGKLKITHSATEAKRINHIEQKK